MWRGNPPACLDYVLLKSAALIQCIDPPTFRIAVVLCLACSLTATALSDLGLVGGDFEKLVFHSEVKASFIMFWNSTGCEACENMRPAWSKLGAEFEESMALNIGSVDCQIKENHPLCVGMQLVMLPSLFYWHPPNKEAEIYELPRDATNLTAFANELARACEPQTLAGCSEAQIEKIEISNDKPLDELETFTAYTRGQLDAARKRWLQKQVKIREWQVGNQDR
jgi:thiol-disulfide isomerase/thioredoxin